MPAGSYFVYILTNSHRTVLYTGVTNNLLRRLYEHRQKRVAGFTAKYRINTLVYFEETPDILAAITREKQIKAGSRAKKVALIEAANPEWQDLAEGWF